MKRLLPVAAALAALVFTAPAQAYWEYGHQTVAEIAWANITPKARAEITRLLRQEKLLGTPQCKAGTLDDAAIWADCIKGIKDENGKQKFGYTSAWHYQDVNICSPFDVESVCKDGNCVSAQIVRDVKLLKDRRTPTKQRVEALVFLIHFVGDLHQPLHAGEKGDKGGNDVKAVYGTYAPSRLNLHTIWDGYLAERAISTGPSLVHRYSLAERKRIAAFGVELTQYALMWSTLSSRRRLMASVFRSSNAVGSGSPSCSTRHWADSTKGDADALAADDRGRLHDRLRAGCSLVVL